MEGGWKTTDFWIIIYINSNLVVSLYESKEGRGKDLMMRSSEIRKEYII